MTDTHGLARGNEYSTLTADNLRAAIQTDIDYVQSVNSGIVEATQTQVKDAMKRIETNASRLTGELYKLAKREGNHVRHINEQDGQIAALLKDLRMYERLHEAEYY